MTKVSQKRSAPKKAASPRQPALPVRVQQKQDTRERIRVAALELFTRDGFAATTTKAVAERAGVASGTVFIHASDKDDLLFLVMHDEIASTVEGAFETLPANVPLLEQLLHLFGAVIRAYAANPELALAFVKALPGARGPNGQRVDALTFAFLHRVAALVRAAQERGTFSPDVPPLLLAQNAFALYFFTVLSSLSGYTSFETAIDPHLRMSLELQLRGLTLPG